MEETGKAIQEFRKMRNMSVISLAKKAGLSRDHIYKLERCDAGPSVRTLKKIAAALDVPPAALIK